MCGPCLQLLTHLCARPRSAASHTRFQVDLVLSRELCKALAFSHQRVTFCFPADIGLQALTFLSHNIFDAVQTFSSFLSASV